MVLSFNKDDKNVGTMSERVFAGRNSPSVPLFVKQVHVTSINLLNYVRLSICYYCIVRYMGYVLDIGRINSNYKFLVLKVAHFNVSLCSRSLLGNTPFSISYHRQNVNT